MREPKFTDAPCFGKEFDPASKICRVCLAHKPCQQIVFRVQAASEPRVIAPSASRRIDARRRSCFHV